VNGVLLQAACYLAYHSETLPPTGCRLYLQDPFHPLLQALLKAEEAYNFALEWKRFALMAKAQLFMGHAYRAMGIWDQAYEAYVRAASHPEFAADTSEEGLEMLTRLCAEMRDGRKPSGRVREVIGNEWKTGVLGGLFRCGTFGDLSVRSRDGAAVAIVQKIQMVREQELVKRIGNDREVVEDGKEDEDVRETGEGEEHDGQGDDFEDETDDKSEIDWIAIGSRKIATVDPHGLKLCVPRLEYRPLRSVRGRLIPRRKLWANR
jgi:hypothetical protein